MGLEYKFVELSVVTDESIEEAVNAWVGRGWLLEGIRFVTTEASRRPQMAFISFTRELPHAVQHERAPLTLAPEHRESSEVNARSGSAGPRRSPEGSAEVNARSGSAGPRSSPEGSAEVNDETAPRPVGPRLVKADPDDEPE
jgi:hypothetical protein